MDIGVGAVSGKRGGKIQGPAVVVCVIVLTDPRQSKRLLGNKGTLQPLWN